MKYGRSYVKGTFGKGAYNIPRVYKIRPFTIVESFTVDEDGTDYTIVKRLGLPDYGVVISPKGTIRLKRDSIMAKALKRVGWIK